MSSDTRLGPNVAGTWYPADGAELSRTVDRLLAENPHSAGVGAPVVGIISPHAGFVYSGATAASAFNAVRPDGPRRVVLLGPSHYASFAGGALPQAGVYRTPLGEVPIDAELVRELGGQQGWTIDDRPFEREHCLEAEIPFLQRRLSPGWSLVPVLVGGGSSPASLVRLAEALRGLVNPETLFVVSSDFTHFGPRFNYVPFRDDLPRQIEQLDMGAVEKIVARDPQGFRRYVAETGATICGRHAIDVLLQVLPANCGAELVAYDTSGRTTGDFDHSVSYASVVFTSPAHSMGELGT
jgi:AmmeMemoRadiSam system protein B